MTFDNLALIEPLRRAVVAQGYTAPTPIQARAIPPLLEGRDVLGCAQTGTGKTAAFALPILQHLSRAEPARGRRPIRALVLSPTRELALQIGDSFEQYGQYLNMNHLVIMGGVNQNPQVAALRRGIDVLVATPGRLLDLQNQGHIDLSSVEFFVLDEADRMLDMGFVHDVRRVLKVLPRERQNLLFSATMPRTIVQLASSFLRDPVQIEVTPQATTVERIDQQVMFVERADKKLLLAEVLATDDLDRAIVFTRTKHGANRVVQQLDRAGIRAAAIHGNKSQNARERALGSFRSGDIRILVATDIASRGLDVDGVSHVVNYDLPNEPESYVHRIGRTGRAGRAGLAISFCDQSEGEFLRDIERLTGVPLEVITDQPHHFPAAIPSQNLRSSSGRGSPGRSSRGGGGGGGGGGRGRSRGRSRNVSSEREATPRRTASAPAAQPTSSATDDGQRRRRRRGGRGRGAGPSSESRPSPNASPRSDSSHRPGPAAADNAPRRSEGDSGGPRRGKRGQRPRPDASERS